MKKRRRKEGWTSGLDFGDDWGFGEHKDEDSVYLAVRAGQSAEEVRRLIAEHGRATVNYVHGKKPRDRETPLQAAHRLRRGDLVAVLLESGADAKAIGPYCHPLALAIHYGLVDTLRVLLRSGRYDANEKLRFRVGLTVNGNSTASCHCCPVHLAITPPLRCRDEPQRPPQLDCLDVLVREFGADVNARDESRETPLFRLADVPRPHRERALDALLALGADLEARNAVGHTYILSVSWSYNHVLQLLLARGASANARTFGGDTPLTRACRGREPTTREAVLALLAVSSRETRRSIDHHKNSAIDNLVENGHSDRQWGQEVIAELLCSAGTPFKRRNAPYVLPIAARLGERRAAELAAVERSAGTTWREHERFVNLAFDFHDLRAAEEAVRRRERRVEELEEELRALGVGTEDTDEDD